MHPYATDSDHTRLALTVLAIAALAAAYGLHRLWTPPWWVDAPSVLGFAGILWRVYDARLWRLRWGPLGLSNVPNLAGRWTGVLSSSHDGAEHEAILTITQTASRIRIKLETASSDSDSFVASVNCQAGPKQGLTYVYDNRPKALAPNAMAPHQGTVHLRLEGDSRLVGDYNSDRFRNTSGRMSFTRGG